jgi:sRNA-binding regulator protein Hfq
MQLGGLYLVGCLIKSLDAIRAKISGAVFLRYEFKAEGEVNLVSEIIGGTLECAGAELSNAKGMALVADSAKIGGNVFLSDGFKAEGVIRFVGATIDGNLACDGAELSNAKGWALVANGTKISGSVFLNNGFEAKGVVSLTGAIFDRDLDCSGGHLSNAEGSTLSVDGTKIGGNVFLRDRFKAEGEVRFMGATIDGNLACESAQLSNSEGYALLTDNAKIGGNIFLREGFKAEGEVRLIATAISGDLDCDGAQFSNVRGAALNVEKSKIGGNVFLRNGFQAQGEVNLLGATIRGLQIVNVLKAEQTIFNLELTEVGTFWDDEKSWPKVGNLHLDGFRYERLFKEAPFQADSRIKWLHRQPRGKFLPQPYEHLAAVLRKMGHERHARLVMIEKNRDRARFTRFPGQAWWWYNIFGKLIGYGYAPWRAFAMSVAMIVLGTFLFHCGFSNDLVTPAKENVYAKAPNGQLELDKSGRPKIVENYPVFNAFVYSLESFIPLIKFDQSANWTPNANRRADISIFHVQVPFTGRFLRYYLYSHIAAGWLLTSLWVGAVTGLVKS